MKLCKKSLALLVVLAMAMGMIPAAAGAASATGLYADVFGVTLEFEAELTDAQQAAAVALKNVTDNKEVAAKTMISTDKKALTVAPASGQLETGDIYKVTTFDGVRYFKINVVYFEDFETMTPGKYTNGVFTNAETGQQFYIFAGDVRFLTSASGTADTLGSAFINDNGNMKASFNQGGILPYVQYEDATLTAEIEAYGLQTPGYNASGAYNGFSLTFNARGGNRDNYSKSYNVATSKAQQVIIYYGNSYSPQYTLTDAVAVKYADKGLSDITTPLPGLMIADPAKLVDTTTATNDQGTSCYFSELLPEEERQYDIEAGTINPSAPAEKKTWGISAVGGTAEEKGIGTRIRTYLDGVNIIDYKDVTEKTATETDTKTWNYDTGYLRIQGLRQVLTLVDNMQVTQCEEVTMHEVTLEIGENGTVSYNGETLTDGQLLDLAAGDYTFSYGTEGTYALKSVSYGETPLVAQDGTVTVTVGTSGTLAFSFENQAQAPEMIETAPSYSFYDASYNNGAGSFVSFFTVNPGKGYTFTDGIAKFYPAGGEEIKLESTEMLGIANNGTWDGKFGVRMYGALAQGGEYVLKPYLKAENGADVQIIEPASDENYTFTFGNE